MSNRYGWGLMWRRASLPAALLVALAVPAGSTGQESPPCAQTADLPGFIAVESREFSGQVGRFSCLPADRELTDVVVQWGDGSSSSGTVTYSEAFSGRRGAMISGSHTYARATCSADRSRCPQGGYTVTTTATDSTGQRWEGGSYVATVLPEPNVLRRVRLDRIDSTRARLTARITTGGLRRKAELRAVISWGDGSRASGRITGTGRNFAVTATHRSTGKRRKAVRLTVTDSLSGTKVSANARR